MTATIDEVAKTLGEFQALVQGAGVYAGEDAPQFSADGATWLPVWPSDGEPPVYARARVYRTGVEHTDWHYVVWAESLPADDEWRDLWERKRVKLFGSFARRNAYRQEFRDVVGDLRGPDEDATGPQIRNEHATADRTDWDAQLADAPDVAALDLVWKDMREDRARTGAREVAYRARREELIAAEWTPEEIAHVADVLLAEAEKVAAELAAAPAPGPAKPGRVPEDHLPGNRAARRAAAKGRRK